MEKVYKMLGYDLHLIPTNKFKNITSATTETIEETKLTLDKYFSFNSK